MLFTTDIPITVKVLRPLSGHRTAHPKSSVPVALATPSEPQLVATSPPRRAPPTPAGPPLQPRVGDGAPLEPTLFLHQHGTPQTERLTTASPDQALDPSDPQRPDPAHHTTQTARTALIPGFGGSLLGESGGRRGGPIAIQGPPSRLSVWWSRATRRFRRPEGKPGKPGWWARIRGVRVGNLPARRRPPAMDRFFRTLAEIPSYIGRGWRLLYRPFGRLTALRSKLSTPLMSLRTTFGRLGRTFSRWTGGGA